MGSPAYGQICHAMENLFHFASLSGKVSFRLAALLKQLEDSQAERDRTLS